MTSTFGILTARLYAGAGDGTPSRRLKLSPVHGKIVAAVQIGTFDHVAAASAGNASSTVPDLGAHHARAEDAHADTVRLELPVEHGRRIGSC